MRHPYSTLLLGLFVVLGGLVACQGGPELAPGEIEAVEHPSLEDTEEVVREQIGKARGELEKAKDRRELADAYGSLGELYHTYDLLPAALSCYRNADTLDETSFLWPYYLGVLHQAEGRLSEAAEAFAKALERRPEDLSTLARLGEVQLAQGQTEAAAETFTPLLEDESFKSHGLFGLGRAANDQGEPSQAIEHLEQVLAETPEAGAVHQALGQAYRALGEDAKAEVHLAHGGSGTISFPDRVMDRLTGLASSSGAYLKRGSAALVNGRLSEAETALRRAVEIDPTNGAAWRNLGHTLLQKPDPKQALDELKIAAEHLPDDPQIHLDLGNLYLVQGLGQRAAVAFEKTVELSPEFVQGRFNLANTLVGLERWDEAAPHLAKVLELEPEHERARLLESRLAFGQGQRRQAFQGLRKFLEEDPENLQVRNELAQTLARVNRFPQAIEVYEEGLTLDLSPEDRLSTLFQLADLEWKRNQQQAAVERWREALALAPESSDAHTRLANGLQLIRRNEEAREMFAKAVELDPNNATARLSEASLWILEGEYGTAKERLEAALERHPEHPGINNTLARLLATCDDPGIRDGQRALDLAHTAFAREDSVDHAETIAMAMAEIGKFEEAIQWQQRLALQAHSQNNRALATRLVQRLKLYQNRRPVRIGG